MKTELFAILILSLTAITACESEGPCSEDVNSRVDAGFYTLSNGLEKKVTVKQLSFYGSQRPDSVIQGNNLSRIDFPLSALETSGQFILASDTLADTIELSYDNRLSLISWECGFTNQFEILSVTYTGNFIDSISIVQTLADQTDEENLKIFFY